METKFDTFPQSGALWIMSESQDMVQDPVSPHTCQAAELGQLTELLDNSNSSPASWEVEMQCIQLPTLSLNAPLLRFLAFTEVLVIHHLTQTTFHVTTITTNTSTSLHAILVTSHFDLNRVARYIAFLWTGRNLRCQQFRWPLWSFKRMLLMFLYHSGSS